MGDVDPQTINAMVEDRFPASTLRCIEIGPDFALCHMVVERGLLRPGGYIAGPTQFAAADSALWYLTFAAIGRIEPMALTSELSIRFLRPAIGEGLWARATLHAAGRRNVVGSVSVWADDNEHRPSAVAQGTYALPRESAGAA